MESDTDDEVDNPWDDSGTSQAHRDYDAFNADAAPTAIMPYRHEPYTDGQSTNYAEHVDDLDQMRKTSVDYYAVIRSLYRQKRKSEISNGNLIEIPAIPDLGYNLGPEEYGAPNLKVAK